jgi:hypothetical protein
MEAKIMETVLSIVTCAVMMQMGGWSLRTLDAHRGERGGRGGAPHVPPQRL